MKYVLRTSENFKEDFLKNLLIDRGTVPDNDEDYLQAFMHPTKENYLNPSLLDHMEEGCKMFLSHLKNGSHIYIAIDPDVDGFTSSAVLYLYMRDCLKELFPNFTVDFHYPEGKEHGLATIMNLLEEEKKYDLIILPDSSSNDYEEHEKLKNMGYDILVLDHHEASQYSTNAIVINNQLSDKYENKNLSGVGVVFKFLQYCDELLKINGAEDYIDLVALGLCADMMDLNTLENRYIVNKGFSTVRNTSFRALIQQQIYSIFGKRKEQIPDMEQFLDEAVLTPIQVAFYIVPLINALIRVGSHVEKERLFLSFIDGDTLIASTKRGHKGEQETIAEQNARNCVNARNRQNKDKEKAIELLDIQIINNCLDDNKILILNADELNVSTTLTGLVAMGVAAKYKKPTFLGRTSPDGCLKGSIRGRGESELKDFKKFLCDSGLVDYVEGHANAAGAGIKVSNVSKLYDYANDKLKNINFNEGFYEVDFIVNGNCSYLNDMILNLDQGKYFYGQNCPEPLILIENITIDKSNMQIMGSNKDTLKITFNGIDYMKFKAGDLINELSKYNGKISLSIVGRGNVNYWGGKMTPQIFIEDIEIKEMNNYDF